MVLDSSVLLQILNNAYIEAVFSKGNTVLQENDRLTIIGNPHDIRSLYDQYGKTLEEPPGASLT